MKGLKWAQGGRRGAPGTGRAAEPRAPARGAPSGVTAAQGTLAMSRPPGAGASTALLWPPELKSSRHVGREGGRGAPSPAQTQRGRLQCAQCPQPPLQSLPHPRWPPSPHGRGSAIRGLAASLCKDARPQDAVSGISHRSPTAAPSVKGLTFRHQRAPLIPETPHDHAASRPHTRLGDSVSSRLGDRPWGWKGPEQSQEKAPY